MHWGQKTTQNHPRQQQWGLAASSCNHGVLMASWIMSKSWVDPGYLATILVSSIPASQIICTLMVWECFLLTKSNSNFRRHLFVCAVNHSGYNGEDASCCNFHFNASLVNITLELYTPGWRTDDPVPSWPVSQSPLECPCCQEAPCGRDL